MALMLDMMRLFTRISLKKSRSFCLRRMRLAHPADCRHLFVKRLPVVALGDGGPYRFHLADVHRAGSIVRPIGVASRAGGGEAGDQLSDRVPRLACIGVRMPNLAAAPVEEETVD